MMDTHAAFALPLRPTPTVLRLDPALASASGAFGSAAQISAAAGMGHSVVQTF